MSKSNEDMENEEEFVEQDDDGWGEPGDDDDEGWDEDPDEPNPDDISPMIKY